MHSMAQMIGRSIAPAKSATALPCTPTAVGCSVLPASMRSSPLRGSVASSGHRAGDFLERLPDLRSHLLLPFGVEADILKLLAERRGVRRRVEHHPLLGHEGLGVLIQRGEVLA